MSITGFLIRFVLVYALVQGAVNTAVLLVHRVGSSSASSDAVVIVYWLARILSFMGFLAVAYWCFHSYSVKNSRIVRGSETWKLVLSALAGHLAVTALFFIKIFLAIASSFPGVELSTYIQAVVPRMLVASLYYFLGLLVVNYAVKKSLLKKHPELGQS